MFKAKLRILIIQSWEIFEYIIIALHRYACFCED